MGTSKTFYFNEKQNELAILVKALGHPARIAILEYLLKVNSCICGDIVNQLPLAQPTVSQHLKELKAAGLRVSSSGKTPLDGAGVLAQSTEPGVFAPLVKVFKAAK